VKHRKKAEFLARIADAFRNDPISSTSDAVTAVFELLSDKIAAGEIEDVRHELPAEIRALWPLPSQTAWRAVAEGV
jgi:uncharacterized protein (DUF2267 family)